MDPCTNGLPDVGESDLDCGGSCKACELDKKCGAESDCKNKNCVAGRCAAPSCNDNKRNQDETATDCGGVCGASCEVDEACVGNEDCKSGVCRAMLCVEASCNDGDRNNAETDVDCGGSVCKATCDIGQLCNTHADCLQPDATDSTMGTAQCLETDVEGEKRCRLACPVRLDDCDGLATNGCETNTDTSETHCGGCNQLCDPPNAAKAHCEFGTCQLDECRSGYDDCDPDKPGCESNLATDPDHCGDCATNCSDTNGEDTCTNGVCGIVCDDGFKDCDAAENPGKNGCEINVLSNIRNCGDCAADGGKVCEGEPDQGIFPVCHDGECSTVDCSSYVGLAACDGDGECNDPLSSPKNCGGCGLECLVENGTPGCEEIGGEYECTVADCDDNFANCDGDAIGCEVDMRTNVRHCGGCSNNGGTDCEAIKADADNHVATIGCQAAGCVVMSCSQGYADCDRVAANGCEVDASATDHCGGCLADEANPGTGQDCSEVYPDASSLNCSSGVCGVNCGANLCPDETGVCDVQLGTIASCRTCGEVCSAPEGAIASCSTANGCQVIYPVKVVETKTGAVSAGTDSPPLSVSFELGSGPGRGLVILASSGGVMSLTFGSTAITPIVSVQIPNHTGYVSIGFLDQAALGSPGTKTVTLSSPWGGKVLTILELENVAQAAARDTNIKTAAGCGGDITQLTDVSTRGSLVVAALHVQYNAAASGTPLGGLTELTDQYMSEQVNGLNGVRENVDGNVTVGFNVSGTCWNHALLTASFNPRVVAQ